MRVLVTWADPAATNLGVQVLAQGVADMARAAWGKETIVDFQGFGRGDDGIAFGGKSVVQDLLTRRTVTRKLNGYDQVIDIGGGDSFADIYGIKRLAWIAYSQRTAARIGARLVLGPQTIGPFKSWVGRRLASHSLAGADVVIARDQQSALEAAALGVDEARIVLSTDSVFALRQEIPLRRSDVLLNVSGLLWRENPHVDASVYRRAVVDLIHALRAEGREITLLPHVLANGTHDDDVAVIPDVRDAAGSDFEVFHPVDVFEARQLISGAQAVIGARMHAVLNALSQGVPALPWAYSRKFRPLMEGLGWDHTIDLRDSKNIVPESLAVLQSPSFTREAALEVRQRGHERSMIAVAALQGSRK